MIANPPYIRHEAIKTQKPQLEREYGDFFCGTADLYTYFFKLRIEKLKPAGHLCFIVPNKFMRAGYGKNSRTLLTTAAQPKVVLDFGDLPIFDATTYPSILLVEKTSIVGGKQASSALPAFGGDPGKGKAGEALALPLQNQTFLVATFTEPSQLRRLEDTIAAVGFTMPVAALRPEGWALERPDVLALMDKLRTIGKPLGEYVEGRFYRGVLTGLNEAFVIDEETKAQLIAEDPKSAEIIKPWLRGRDIKKWQAEWAGLYVIAIASSGNKVWPWSQEKSEAAARQVFERAYPAVHRYLSLREEGLRKRDDQGWFWWELRACGYWEEFEKHKIGWSHFSTTSEFVYDEQGVLSNDKSYIMPTNYLSLIGFLNSKTTNFFIGQLSPPVRGGFMELRKIYLEQLPIPPATDAQKAAIIERVHKILDAKKSPPAPLSEGGGETIDIIALETEIDQLIYALYNLTADEIVLVEGKR